MSSVDIKIETKSLGFRKNKLKLPDKLEEVAKSYLASQAEDAYKKEYLSKIFSN